MPLIYTADELIRSTRRMGMIPNTAAKGTADSDLLIVLTEILWTKLVPNLMRVREEYYGAKVRLPIVANVTEYRIPSRAMLQKLDDIWYFDGVNLLKLTAIPHEDLHLQGGTGFYLEGNRIVIPPGLSQNGGSLEVHFFSRPGSLVLSASARQVTAVNLVTKQITLASAPPSSWVNGVTLDIHSQKSGAEGKVWDNAITNVASAVVTVADAIDGSTFGTSPVEIGDWACLAGEAALPGAPVEYHPILALATALRCAVSGGDIEVAKAHASEYSADMKAMVGVTESRVERKPLRIRGRGGILRSM